MGTNLRLSNRRLVTIRNLQDISLITNELLEQIHSYADKLKANPEDANLHNNLGLLYREGGDVSKAEHHFQEALPKRILSTVSLKKRLGN